MLFWKFLSIFGNIIFWLILTLFLTVLFLIGSKKIKKKIFWFISTVPPSVVLGLFVTEIIKVIFKVQRPCNTPECLSTYSFPSGHATVIFAAVTAISLHNKDWRLVAPMMIFASLVSISRVMLRLHRVEDIFVGCIIGILISILIQRLYERKFLPNIRYIKKY